MREDDVITIYVTIIQMEHPWILVL